MITILAPHADDELIGCFSILHRLELKVPITVVYTSPMSPQRGAEAERLCKHLRLDTYYFNLEDVGLLQIPRGTEILVAPDPCWECHPVHKTTGSMAVVIARRLGLRLLTYSTSMNAPYLRELSEPDSKTKRDLLNRFYPSQKSLWEHDYRYFLFEGICEWNPDVLLSYHRSE